MSNYVIYNTTSGKIVYSIMLTNDTDIDSITANVGVGEDYLQGGDSDAVSNSYVNAGVVVPLLEFEDMSGWDTTTISANGTSTATFGSALPNPTQVQIRPDTTTTGATALTTVNVTDGSLSFATFAPAVYSFEISAFPYRTIITTVTAS